MSSHHFVKEGQEPALFILEALSLEIAQPLLEWVPTVIVADSAVEQVLQWGIKIDIVLQSKVPFQELEEMLVNQIPIQIISCKTDNVVAEGLQFLIENHSTAVNFIAEPDAELLKKLEKFIHQLQIGVFSKTQKWSAIVSIFEKWLPAGSKIAVKAHHSSGLQLQGLVQKGEEWETTNAGLVKVQARSPFWIGEWS
ncbi:MAG TPA: hypothetical protein VJ184_16190 [Chryseolinea sp.]|nr:hypothetical protein [Chryseolinea sp.]